MGGINDYIRIGQKMKHIREMSGISQKDMAIKLGIAQSSYSNYENENREPPFSLICLFCEKFGGINSKPDCRCLRRFPKCCI